MTTSERERIGITGMEEGEIDAFLSSQGVGVLGLPADGVPYLVPLSFGFDGEDAIYFTFVGGTDSRKRELGDRADRAGFLVYKASTPYTWQSVVLSGPIASVPESEVPDLGDVMGNAWYPDAFDVAVSDDGISVYRLEIETKNGLKQTGLPPRFEA
ncbi:pyridoxamine 5'-phosphate oxidase family protein [Halosimplex amylolyticum]|uniref:pyridoxamine 5'-phosphate oxidase family protein n=1 Tax=Halosimplex amylolyticum TaxID=3396616 RepID=UPI003F56D372